MSADPGSDRRTDHSTDHRTTRTPVPKKPSAAFAFSPRTAPVLLTPEAVAAFGEVCALAPRTLYEFHSPEAREVLRETEVLITGWECPPLDAAALAAAPRLTSVVHTAGSVRGVMTEAAWERGIEISSAAAANALPVAEYTVAMILLTGKRVLESARTYRTERTTPDWTQAAQAAGNYRRTVGLLSASLIGRRVIELLRPYELRILLYDPFVDAAEAAALGVELVGLDELFARSDTVSVHTPLLPETRQLVSRELIGGLRPDAVLINTARGAVVDQEALTEAVLAGRVRAVLDVTDPELLPPDHPLWTCPGALLTPHVAGSQGNEWQRLTDFAVGELRRWAAGEGFAHPVRRERLAFLA
ncbi:hydroxyacid dehydrogenase [Streptomyces sp. TRM66268-LWL]|uniref:Hydroxyacid dehydrogenase n=1 Tax=Streptomyces polyasparticus TaxID=2767826 RepID=A0ABR7SFM8_9ACTN|nr:hydroxyacid dehydrogenase [Streptomyces polyasparticus]MBC9713276.1 hydroxyacid dehydrogenase [Streptomyces polyasparticus]